MGRIGLPILLLALASLTPWLHAPLAAEEQPKSEEKPALEKLDIRAKGGKAWNAELADVEKVLRAAASELWQFYPGRKLPAILVEPKGGPITLFERGPNGEIRVRLNTGGLLWAQYTFQFSHEFGHILCSYKESATNNKWFEESICELASLFVLRRSAETWKTRPPYSHWKNYAAALAKYADERIKASPLPEGKTLAQWYRDNAEALARNPTDRPKNNIVAVQLLPLFEKTPEHWAAAEFLNTEKYDASYTFQRYLEAWHKNSPEEHRAFIRDIAAKFEITIEPAKEAGK